ncbi:MAG: GNAT family N-acetyltransferase [Candidatus Omnitrophota bacterium]|jgi:phosphotransferase system HPr (HPr) family protein
MLKAEIDKQLNGLEAERELKSVILAKKPGAAGIKKELLNDRHCICSYWKKASEGLVLPKEALLRQSLVELDAIEREFESLSAGKTGIAGNKELAGLIEDIGKNAMGYHFALSYLLEYGGESLISAGSVAANLLRRLENIVGFCRQMRGRSGEAEETLTGEESGQTQVSAEGFGEEEGEEKTNISKELTVAKLYLDHLADYIKFFMKQDAKAKPVIDYDIDEAEGEENDDDGLFSLKGPLDRHLKKIDARPEVDLEIDILSWRRATEAVTLLKYAAAKTGILKKNDLKLISEIRKTASKCLKAFRNRKKGTLLSGVDLDKYGSRVVTMIWRLEDIVRLCGKIASKRKNPPPGGTKDGGWDEKDRGNKGRGKTLRDFGMLVVATAVTRLIAPWLGVIVGILACYVLVSHIADMFGSREEGGEPEPAPAGTEETRSADQEKMTLEEAYRFLYGLYGDPGTRLGDDDINFSKELAEEILKRPIDRIMIVGTGLIMLPLLLALTGKNVTLVGLDPVWEKAMPELVRVVNDELVKAGKFGDIEIKALTSEIGALDLEEHGLEPHSFDLVTFIDLIGTAYPKGEPSAWIRKAEELLKPEAYLVADESQGLITEAFDETFPRREMLSGGVYFKGAYEAEGSKNRFYRISNASKTRPEVPGMAKKKPAAGAEEKLTEVPDNRKMAIKEFAALLELLKKDPKVAWGKKNEFSARVEYENVTQDFEVFPTKECLESYPELELLDMSTGDDKVPSLGLFGVLRINVVKRGDELALWFREVHPSRGYRQIKPEKRRIAEYGPWSSRTIEHIIGLARQAGFKRFYASTAKNRAEWYKRELKVKIMSKNLEENYFLPFVNGWEEIEVELDGQRTRFWRWTNTKSTTKAPGRSSGKPEYIAQAEALIGSIGITEGSTVVSVGPGMSGTPSYYEQYPVVPWEKLFISEGADVSVYEPDLHSNKQWQNLVNVWQRRYSGKLKVLPSEQGYFEKAEIEPASVDAVVMMSVLSSKGISVMAKAMILLNALKSLKPEGRLVIGWFNGTKNQSKEYERTREIIQMLKNMGYVFEQVAGGAEPRATRGEHKRRFLTHNWVCYKIKPPAASQQNDRTYDGISPSGRKFFAKGIIAFIAASLAIARSAFAQAASEASARTQTYFSEILELFYDHPVLAGTAAFFAICTAFITAYLSHKVVKNKLKLSVTRTEVHDYTQYWPVAYHGQASRVAKGTDEYERDIRVCEVEDFTGTWIFLKATLLPVFLNALVNIVACSLGILNNIQTIVIIPLIGIPAGLLLLVLVLFAELIFPYFRIIMKHLYWRTVISDLYPRKHRIQSRALREMWKKKEELPEWDEKPLIFNIYHASKNTVTILDKPAYAVKTPGKETKELRIGQKLDYLPASMHEDPSSASGFVRIDPLKEGRTPDAEELFYKAAKLLVSASVNGGKNLILTGASRNIIEKGFGIELPGVLSLGEFTGIIESAKRGKKVKTGERTAALATDIASFGFSVRSHVRDVKITAPHGIHARSAKSIVEACQNYPNVKAMLLNGGRKAEAGSLLELICLGAGQNAVVRIVAEGKGANLLIEEIAGCLDPGSGKTKDRSPPKEEDKFVSPVQFREWTEAGEWGFAMTEIRELLKLPAENAKKILRDYLLEVDVKHHMDIIEKMKSAPDAENFDTFINHAEEVLQRSNDAQLIEAKRPLEPEQENNLKITHYNGGEQIEEDLLSRADELAKSVFRGGFLKLKERMKNPVFKLVLAVVKERPVGFMLYSLGQESARVSYYGVSDDQRRKGIAKAMFRELIEKTRREGAKKLVLDRVNDTDPAMKKIYEMLEREFRLKLKEKIQRLDGTASMVDAVFEIPYIEKEAPEKAIVRTPESPLRDLRDPIEAAECLKDLLVTLWYNKKVVLAFDSELGNRQVGNPLDVTESLKRLKKDPMYKRVLKNLVIVKSKPEKLHNKVQKYLYDDSSAIFVFAKAGAKKTLRKLSSKPRVRSTFIDENGMPSDTHYPLAEIVTIALAEYIRSMISGKNPTTKLMMGDQMLDLEKINIESITKEEGVLIVKLYTKATKQDTQLILQKYAELKRCLKAA